MITDVTATMNNQLNRPMPEKATTAAIEKDMSPPTLTVDRSAAATPVDVEDARRKQHHNMGLAHHFPKAPARAAPVILSVEAAIGTGKSTLLRLLQAEEPSWVFVQEPVDIWQAVDGKHNLLEAFYKDPARYAFSFQTYCVLSRIEAVEAALAECPEQTPVMIVERSWFSDRHTFAAMLMASGKISDMEAALYRQWYDFAARNGPRVHGHLYLEADPATCMLRLKRRGRSEETAVTVEYQSELIDYHERWLRTVDPAKVCRVNVDDDFLSDADARARLMARIHSYVDELRQFSA